MDAQPMLQHTVPVTCDVLIRNSGFLLPEATNSTGLISEPTRKDTGLDTGLLWRDGDSEHVL